MIALFLLAWFVIYHGGVLWLALRFKGKPWRWYWFLAVLFLGWAWAWWDKPFIDQVVVKDWCQRPEVGFHELAPIHITHTEVTWLTPTRWPNGDIKGSELVPESQKLVQEKRWVRDEHVQISSSNRLLCGSAIGRDSPACVVKGYRVQTEQEDIRLLGRYIAAKERNLLLRDETILRDSVSYRWGNPWFFAVIGMTGLGSSGDCGIATGSNRVKAKDIEIEE